MKKTTFVCLLLGTVSGILFALGMCMALIPEWNTFWPGVIFGSFGIVLGLITVLIYRKLNHKAPIRISGKSLLTIAVCFVGALLLGFGMCFVMVWNQMPAGIIIGIVGILLLLCLIPIIKGFKD